MRPAGVAGLALALLLLAGCSGEDDPGQGSGEAVGPAPTTAPAPAASSSSPSSSPRAPVGPAATGAPTSAVPPTGAVPGAQSSSTSSPTSSLTSSSATPSTADPGQGPAAATGEPTVATTTLPPVAAGQEAGLGNGLVAEVTGVRAVDVEAAGPGDVSGPGAAVALRLRNDGTSPVDLSTVAVTASYAGGTPAEPSAAAPATTLSGELAPGGSTSVTSVFRVPRDQVDDLTVLVGSGSAPSVVAVRP